MKKTYLILAFALFAGNSFARAPIEKLTYQRYAEAGKSCNKPKTDSQRIACLEDMVRYLQAKIDLNYYYYSNSLTIANIPCYNGDLKNCWE